MRKLFFLTDLIETAVRRKNRDVSVKPSVRTTGHCRRRLFCLSERDDDLKRIEVIGKFISTTNLILGYFSKQ